jgi:hypothetical protein
MSSEGHQLQCTRYVNTAARSSGDNERADNHRDEPGAGDRGLAMGGQLGGQGVIDLALQPLLLGLEAGDRRILLGEDAIGPGAFVDDPLFGALELIC